MKDIPALNPEFVRCILYNSLVHAQRVRLIREEIISMENKHTWATIFVACARLTEILIGVNTGVEK